MKNRSYIIVLLLCTYELGYSQIYITGRGTTIKKEIIGEEFNLSNKNLTHIGVAYKEKDSLVIYNVSSDRELNGSSLIVESWAQFINGKDVFYTAIWELKISKKQQKQFKNRLQKYLKNKIQFDDMFKLDNNKLYCSEFVAKILNESKIGKYLPTVKDIKQSNKLIYYPVDFFLSNIYFNLIYTNTN